jgi:hypothetical protein
MPKVAHGVPRKTMKKQQDIAGTPLSQPPCSDFNFDRTSSGHERLNCRCGRAVVRQPYMNLDQWMSAIRNFEKHIHNCPNTVLTVRSRLGIGRVNTPLCPECAEKRNAV